jgi:hypothetical protein
MKVASVVLFLAGATSLLGGMAVAATTSAPVVIPAAMTSADHGRLLTQYCSGCHNDKLHVAGWSVEKLDPADLGRDDEMWEKILAKLSLGEMPPKGMKRPPSEQIADFTHWLETGLDRYALAHVNPGRATLRRMNRAEYANAVRDLLSLNVDVRDQLPPDDSGYGFDNIADVLTVSPTLMDRYIAVAAKVSRQAMGMGSPKPSITIYRIPKDPGAERRGVPSFNERSDDRLPLDSRGGGAFQYQAPYDGTYLVRAYLNTNGLADNDILKSNSVEIKVPLKAGPRLIGMYFEKPMALDETVVKSVSAANSVHGLPTGIVLPDAPPTPLKLTLAIDGTAVQSVEVPSYASSNSFFQNNYPRDLLQIQVDGPYDPKGQTKSPSQRKLLICRPSAALPDSVCARKIIARLAGQAYRRPLTPADIAPLMRVYEQERKSSDFEHGIQLAIRAILVSPQFLFMEERDPAGAAPGFAHRVSDLELATRISFFLWSSLPDRELVTLAAQGKLKNPKVLKAQVHRMLADPRAHALTTEFTGQWLYLRNLQYSKPNADIFPQFDIRLRKAMATETEMFFDSIVRENRSVLDFVTADYTFLNQRLAEHYGIPAVYGSTFRRVKLDPSTHRGGLLGQGSILTVTSFDNRTSVVKRGKWILDNLLAAPPPPPPPNIPALNETPGGRKMTVRQMMDVHRSNAICATCHSKIDPLGFSLENFNAVGAWRDNDAGQTIDASAVLPDGTQFEGTSGLQKILLARKDQFVDAFVERLLTYALGRGLEAYDMPAVRIVRRQAAADAYRMDTIILGIIESVPFQMRTTPTALKRTAEK